MSKLAGRHCVPCRGGVPPLTPAEARRWLAELPAWRLVADHHLSRSWTFPDFARALAFVNRVAALAEAERHHPEIQLGWGHVRLDLWTHAIDGLSENDFVLAARIDELPAEDGTAG